MNKAKQEKRQEDTTLGNYRCDHCSTEEVATDMKKVALYECGKCNEKFVAFDRACPKCNMFAKKIGKHGCLQCGEGQLIKISGGQPA